jgi:hypothetical protein
MKLGTAATVLRTLFQRHGNLRMLSDPHLENMGLGRLDVGAGVASWFVGTAYYDCWGL